MIFTFLAVFVGDNEGHTARATKARSDWREHSVAQIKDPTMLAVSEAEYAVPDSNPNTGLSRR
jgi:hypothetical protein